MTNGMDALGDPTRRAIFERLAGGPRAVGELANELPVSRPAVSQHLKVLKEAGLVGDRAQGTRRLYRSTRAAWARCATTSTGSGSGPGGIQGRRRGHRRQGGHMSRRRSRRCGAPSSSRRRPSAPSRCSPRASRPGGPQLALDRRGRLGTAIIEPAEGGRWYERGKSTAPSATGARSSPTTRRGGSLLTWQLDAELELIATTPSASEIEVPSPPRATARASPRPRPHRPSHRGRRAGEGVAGEGGWRGLLARYAEAVSAG